MIAPSMSLLEDRITDVEERLWSYHNRMTDRQVQDVQAQLAKAHACVTSGNAERGIAALEETRGVFTDVQYML